MSLRLIGPDPSLSLQSSLNLIGYATIQPPKLPSLTRAKLPLAYFSSINSHMATTCIVLIFQNVIPNQQGGKKYVRN